MELITKLVMNMNEKIDAGSVNDDADTNCPARAALNSAVDDFVYQLQTEGENLRRKLLNDEDLLPDDEKRAGKALTSLRKTLSEHMNGWDDAALTVVACLVAVHLARYETRPKGIKFALQWADRQPQNTSIKDWLPLRIANQHHELSEARSEEGNLPTPRKLEELSESIDACGEHNDTEHKRHQLRLRLWLAEAITEVPPFILRKESSDGIRDIARDLLGPAESKSTTDQMQKPSDQMQARFALVRSALAYCSRDGRGLNEAKRQCRLALELTSGTDRHFIERCQNRLDYLELEHASSDANREYIASEIEKRVESGVKSYTTQALESSRVAILKETRDEIKNSLLRVVEILGVFLAVTGVAVTAIGGIAVEGSLGARIAIWFFGYASLVSLFWLLRKIIEKAGESSESLGSEPPDKPGRRGLRTMLTKRRPPRTGLTTQENRRPMTSRTSESSNPPGESLSTGQ